MREQQDVALIWQAIDALNFEPIKLKMMHPEGGPARDLADVERAEHGYRQFLKLTAKYPELVLAPSREIDDFWHGHILDTCQYAADCQHVFGFFLHHDPYLGVHGPEDEARLFAAHKQFNELVRCEFGACDADAPAYCAKADISAAAYCARAEPQAAYCAKAGMQAAAYCAKSGANQVAYCAKADELAATGLTG